MAKSKQQKLGGSEGGEAWKSFYIMPACDDTCKI